MDNYLLVFKKRLFVEKPQTLNKEENKNIRKYALYPKPAYLLGAFAKAAPRRY